MILTYINPLNKNFKGELTYEFLFSEDTEIDLGEDWDVQPASSGAVTPPPIESIIGVGILKTEYLEFDLAIFSDNFSIKLSMFLVIIGNEKLDTKEFFGSSTDQKLFLILFL